MSAQRIQPQAENHPPPPGGGDAALVIAARADRLAFAPLYERYRDDVLRYCFYCLGDWDEAADAAQQIFANAMAGLPRFADRGDSFRPWLFRIAHNEVCTRQTRRSRRPQNPLQDAAEVVDPAPSPEDLAITALVVVPGRFDGSDVAGIRSVFAPETSISGVTIEGTLLAATLPAEALPHGDRISGNLSHFTIEPGVKSSWEPALAGCCPGLRVDFVVEGELVMRPSGPARVLRSRANLAPRQVAAGTEVVLGTGDALMSRYEDPFASANAGTAPVRLLDWVFVDGYVTSNHGNPSGWDYHFDGRYEYNLTLPEQPATLRLERIRLEPGAQLALSSGALAHFALTVADDEPLGWESPGIIENLAEKPITVHVLTVTPVESGRDAAAPLPGSLVLEVGAAGDTEIARRADDALLNIGVAMETIDILTLTPVGGTETARAP